MPRFSADPWEKTLPQAMLMTVQLPKAARMRAAMWERLGSERVRISPVMSRSQKNILPNKKRVIVPFPLAGNNPSAFPETPCGGSG